MLAQVKIIFISLSLGGCFYMPVVSKGKVSTLDEAPRMAATVSSTESKAIAAYDPASKVATTIPAPSGALAGSSVTLPAGALAIAAELVVEEAVPLSQTSVTGSLNISADITIKPVGAGLIIRPTQDLDLTKPLTIAMPINPTAGLHNWLARVLALNADTHYTVFYKYFVNGELKAGAIPSATLRFSDSGSVLFEGYFGAYWLAEVSAPIQEKMEIKSDEPIINKDNVAVVTHTGVVTETEILAKAAVPSVEWLSVSLSLNDSLRAVKASATIAAGRSLRSCRLDLFDSKTASSGIEIDVGSTLSADYTVTRQVAHNLYARFRCLDDESRLAISPWSAPVSLSAVAQAPATSTKPAYDFCSTTPPGISLLLGTGTSPLLKGMGFIAQGSCVYTLDVDTLGDFSFGIQTSDQALGCSTASVKIGDQSLSCVSSSEAIQPMTLPQGNYRLKLDFSTSLTQPKLSVELQPCSLGDMYLLSSSYGTWPVPDASNRMQHLGGCQYAIETPWNNTATSQVRLSNGDGSFVCGDNMGPYLDSGKSVILRCGAPVGDPYYSQHNSGMYVTANRYLVNLANNLDVKGNPTNVPYIHFTEIDKCTENFYLLGPTAAGNSRNPLVNGFKEEGACNLKFYWLRNEVPVSPFYIGRGEGAEKCGLSYSPAGTTYVALDCSATALPIDMTALALDGKILEFNVQLDGATGQPMNLNVTNNADAPCHDTYYASRSAVGGYYFNPSRVLTEVEACVYEYDWTPTATDRNFVLLPSGTSTSSRYGVYLGYSQPVVDGPAVELTPFSSMSSSTYDYEFPISPWGIQDGQRYKVTLDLRLGNYRPKLSISRHSPVSCPDFYVVGLGWSANDPASRMTRVGDCNYAFTFKAPAAGTGFHIADAAGTIKCGLDPMAGNPISPGPAVNSICSSGTPDPFSSTVAASNYYQIRLHFDGSQNAKLAFQQHYPSCTTSEFVGLAAAEYPGSKYFNYVNGDMCLQELFWTPTTSTKAFRIKDMSGNMNYCGLKSGAPQLSLNGVETEALCNIMSANKAIDFVVAEDITPNITYRIALDRRNPFAPPRISITQTAQP
jgi:hypothetical protein